MRRVVRLVKGEAERIPKRGKPVCICTETKVVDRIKWTITNDRCPIHSPFYRLDPKARKAVSPWANV